MTDSIFLTSLDGAKTSSMDVDSMIVLGAGDFHGQLATDSVFTRKPSIFDTIVLRPDSE